LVRFLGLHCLSVHEKRQGSRASRSVQKLYFVVMANMFNTPLEIHRRYDLKGSWVGRVTSPDEHDSSVTLKDVDFTQAAEVIRVGPQKKAALMTQLELDTAFLRDNGIIDYSMLVGIHEVASGTQLNLAAVESPKCKHSDMYMSQTETNRTTRSSACGRKDALDFLTRTISLDSSAPHRVPTHQADLGGMLSPDGRFLYFIGVIDILTTYDSSKMLEHQVKALIHDRHGVSCCPPVPYAARLTSFMQKAFE